MKRARNCDNLICRASLWALFAALALLAATPSARAQNVCALPGNDNVATLSGVINTYYPGTASASVGATSIQVGAARFDGASVPITAGDLLLVIQMQDAAINATNGTAYGANNGTARGASNINNSGRYEYVVATTSIGLGANTVSIRGLGGANGLIYSYTNAAATGTQGQRKFQVVRVPQYASATLTSGLSAASWDHVTGTGGILAFDVAGTLNLAGATVSVNGRGFRGGGGRPLVGGRVNNVRINNSIFDYAYPTSVPLTSTIGAHGTKGEGIAGTPRYIYDRATDTVIENSSEGYPGGSNARGAPGNAGGGGTDSAGATNNEANSGGGGGGNGGNGGQGGNTWRDNEAIGGLGGAVVANDATRVVLGGGGGAGSRNNSVDTDSSGGAGGGIILIRTATISGTGTLTANGDDALNSTANDGGGGGGAGGSVIVTANSSLAGLTIRAWGGRGGDAWRTGGTSVGDRHGPGGGGAGGFIAYTVPATGGTPNATATGGANGLTTTLADAYGATPGGNGTTLVVTQANISGIRSGAQCVPLLTVTKTTSTAAVTNTTTGATATYTITVSNAANRVSATSVTLSDALPAGFTFRSNGTVTFTNGATRPSVTNPAVGATNPAWSAFTIPATGQVQLTFTVDISASITTGTYQNPATATYFDPARTVANGTTFASYNSASSTNEDVTVTSTPDLTITKSHTGNFTRGETGIYTVTVTNSGPGTTGGTVTVTDTLPAGLTPTAPVGLVGGWTCSISTQTVTCIRADGLSTGASYPAIDITVNVLQTAANSVTNTASTSGGGETNTANNSANDATTIVSRADLSLTKTADNSAPLINQNVTFTLTVSNAGPSNASGITVRDQLPAGLSFVSAAPSAAYNSATGVWTVGTVNASASSTLQITARVTTSGTTITNTAEVTASGAPDPDSTPNNNNASEDDQASAQLGVPVPPEVKLQKRCTAPANCEYDPQLPGTELTYTITFTNTAGTSAAQGLTIIDIIPITDTSTSIVRNTEFKVGSMTFNPGTSTLSIVPTDYRYYNDPLLAYPLSPPWTPSSAYTASGAYDFNVTYVGWKLTGTMPPGTSGSVSFTVRIR
ncbi:MAG TPA: DUF11 domain-containing protein [Pyrinomonadaceae bacterium]|nr:DUF11 domain-containing protein [Pyrinomonadaceae bacterium]